MTRPIECSEIWAELFNSLPEAPSVYPPLDERCGVRSPSVTRYIFSKNRRETSTKSPLKGKWSFRNPCTGSLFKVGPPKNGGCSFFVLNCLNGHAHKKTSHQCVFCQSWSWEGSKKAATPSMRTDDGGGPRACNGPVLRTA